MKCFELIKCKAGHLHPCYKEAAKIVPIYTLDGDEIGGSFMCAHHAALAIGRDALMSDLRTMARKAVQSLMRDIKTVPKKQNGSN